MVRMEALIELERGSSGRPRFVARTGGLRELARSSRFSVLFDHWRTVGGTFDEGGYQPILARFTGDRYVLFEPCSQGLGFNIVRAGKGLQIPDKPSHEALAGSRLESVADRAYGQWGPRDSIALRSNPAATYDHIRAFIRWPRAGRVERKYSRLILPCRTMDGRPLLLGASGATAAPDLDVEAA